MLGTEAECECPNCRGVPTPKAIFKHLGGQNRRTARQAHARMQADDSGSGNSIFSDAISGTGTPQSPVHSSAVLMMTSKQLAEYSNSWSNLPPAEYFRQQNVTLNEATSAHGNVPSGPNTAAPVEESVHLKSVSRTKLPGGKHSLLVDLGSRINVIGKNTEKEFADKSTANGLETTYIPRQQRLYINGVGTDSARCDHEAVIPIAVKFEEQEATKESYRANIADGCGENLPAILGSESMQEKDSVLILRKGKELIAFPGPGGYKIEWSPGTKLLPMVPAPSGHLVIPCDRFAELPKGKNNTEQISFWTDHSKSE